MFNAGFILTLVGWALLLSGIVAQRYRIGEYPWTFLPMPLGLLLCAAASVLLLWSLIVTGGDPLQWLGLALAVVPWLAVGGTAGRHLDKPLIHDVTTAEKGGHPTFLWANGVRAASHNPLQRSAETHARVRRLQSEAYDDLQPLLLGDEISRQDVFRQSKALALERGWRVIGQSSPTRLEATAETRLLRFQDDIVLEVTDLPQGGIRVDMRSVSRVGKGDFGANYRRVRSFLVELQRRLSGHQS